MSVSMPQRARLKSVANVVAIEDIVVNDGNGSDCGASYDERVDMAFQTVKNDKAAFARWIVLCEKASNKFNINASQTELHMAAASIRSYYVEHLLEMTRLKKSNTPQHVDIAGLAREANESFVALNGADNGKHSGIFNRINGFYGLNIEMGTRVKTESDKFGTVVGTENGKNLSGNCIAIVLDDDMPTTRRFFHATSLIYSPEDDPKLEKPFASSAFRP